MKIRSLLNVAICSFLVGCANTPPAPTPQQALVALTSSHPLPIAAIKQQLAHPTILQDTDAQWQGWWVLCQHDIAVHRDSVSCEQALDIAITSNDSDKLSFALLANYYATGNEKFKYKAKQVGQLHFKNLLEVIDHPTLASCLDPTVEDVFRAMLCYQVGKEAHHKKAMQQALTLFTLFDAKQKMADSLFVLAKIEYSQGNKAKAIEYAAQSALILTQEKQYRQAEFVRQWRTELLL